MTIRVDHRLRAAQPDSLEALARVGAAIQPTPDDVRILHAAGVGAAPRPAFRADVDQQRAYDRTTADLRASARGDRVRPGGGRGRAAHPRPRPSSTPAGPAGRRGRPATGWSSLTPTELEVVRLVAEGLTNPQIGARLLMSRGTVKTHLSHIFTKLDTANRAQLAAAAIDRGLVRASER